MLLFLTLLPYPLYTESGQAKKTFKEEMRIEMSFLNKLLQNV